MGGDEGEEAGEEEREVHGGRVYETRVARERKAEQLAGLKAQRRACRRRRRRARGERALGRRRGAETRRGWAEAPGGGRRRCHSNCIAMPAAHRHHPSASICPRPIDRRRLAPRREPLPALPPASFSPPNSSPRPPCKANKIARKKTRQHAPAACARSAHSTATDVHPPRHAHAGTRAPSGYQPSAQSGPTTTPAPHRAHHGCMLSLRARPIAAGPPTTLPTRRRTTSGSSNRFGS